MSDNKEGRPSDTRCARLIALASGFALYTDLDGTPYCSVGDNNEALPLSGETIKHKLTFAFFSEYGTAPGAAVSDALEVLISKAKCEGPRVPVFVRTGQVADGRTIYLDLADGTGRAVEIGAYPDGWQIVAKPECRFVRPLGLRALPVPLRTDANISLTGLLKPFLSCGEEDTILLVSWLVQALRPTGPYPICVLHGEQGSAKSSVSRLLRRIVDPNAAELRGHPRSEDDYILAARNAHVLCLDNLSTVAPWFSDLASRVSTGGGLSKRRLYSDGSEVLAHVQRPQIFNGIPQVVSREDLVSRSLLCECLPVPSALRRTETEFWRSFEKAHPSILGVACSVLSVALAHYETAPVGGDFRLSDFAQFLNAAENSPKLGWPRGAFVAAYARNQIRATRGTAENSPILTALLSILRAEKKWEGTTGQLLEKLRSENTYDWHNPESPRSARQLAEMLKRLAPALRQEGLTVIRERSNDRQRDRLLRIVWQGDGPQKPEPELTTDGLLF